MENFKNDKEALIYAIEALEECTSCTFWACNGPDVSPVDMSTCSRCRSLWELKRYTKHRKKDHGIH